MFHKLSFLISIPGEQNSTYLVMAACFNVGEKHFCNLYRTPHVNKVMLKILQDRLQQYGTQELPDVQAAFRKGRGTRD